MSDSDFTVNTGGIEFKRKDIGATTRTYSLVVPATDLADVAIKMIDDLREQMDYVVTDVYVYTTNLGNDSYEVTVRMSR